MYIFFLEKHLIMNKQLHKIVGISLIIFNVDEFFRLLTFISYDIDVLYKSNFDKLYAYSSFCNCCYHHVTRFQKHWQADEVCFRDGATRFTSSERL